MSLLSEYVHAIDLDVHEILRSDMKLVPSLTERLTDFINEVEQRVLRAIECQPRRLQIPDDIKATFKEMRE